MLRPFNTVPHVAVTPHRKIIFIHNYNFATVMICHVNIWHAAFVKERVIQSPKGSWPTGWEPLCYINVVQYLLGIYTVLVEITRASMVGTQCLHCHHIHCLVHTWACCIDLALTSHAEQSETYWSVDYSDTVCTSKLWKKAKILLALASLNTML